MKKAFNFLFVTTKSGFFLLAALLWSGVMYFVNNHFQITWEEIFVEADGMVFDLIVFGVVLTIYEAFRDIKENEERVFREKKEKIERLHEEIDDYRGWDEKEAMYRIVGAIKRLNKLGESKIDLQNCFLSGANLSGANLSEADFSEANLSGANLRWANLSGANLFNADFSEADLLFTNLQRANLMLTRFQEAVLNGAALQGAILQGVILQGAWLQGAGLHGAILVKADFPGADLLRAKAGENWLKELDGWKVKGRDEIIEKYLIDENGILQLK